MIEPEYPANASYWQNQINVAHAEIKRLVAVARRMRSVLTGYVVLPNETTWNGTQWQCKLCGAVSLDNADDVKHQSECLFNAVK